jgi:hypothetical protein
MGFTATLDGISFLINDLGVVLLGVISSNLLNGSHVLNLTGVTKPSGANLNGSINIQAVPIPAAIWLFGSAIACMFHKRHSKLIFG